MGDLPPQLGCFSRNVIIDFAIMFRYQSYQNHMKVSWNGYPPSHPFIHGDFHEIKHPASLGYPHDFGNLHFYGPGFGEASSLRPVVDSWELRTQLSSDGWNEKNETIHKIGFMGLRGPFSVETMVVTSKFAGGSSRCSLQPLLGFGTSVSVFF